MAILNSILRAARFACWLPALGAMMANGQNFDTAAEYKIKAVYLIKFVQYVDWPSKAFAGDTSPLVIGVLGSDPFGRVLDEVAEGEVVKNRRVEVRRYHTLQEAEEAHVLFIGQSEARRLGSILNELKGKSILTVSDIEGFSVEGGVVRFIMVNNKVHFRVNVDIAREDNLQISSKLLQLAEIVHTPDH